MMPRESRSTGQGIRSVQTESSGHRDASRRPSRQTKLLSIKKAEFPNKTMATSSVMMDQCDIASCISRPTTPMFGVTKAFDQTSTNKAFSTETFYMERIVYDEKVEPRKGQSRVIPYRQYAAKTDIDHDDDIMSSDYCSDNSLSDFIVNDSASESELRKPPPSMRKKKIAPPLRTPRNTRRIILDDEDEDDLPVPQDPGRSTLADALQELSLNILPNGTPLPQKNQTSSSKDGGKLTTSTNHKESAVVSFNTPPFSPSKIRLQSPTKSHIQIPQSPHRQSIDAFWAQDVINDWNDVYSPQKTQKVKKFFDLKDACVDWPQSESPKRDITKSPSKKDKSVIERKRLFDSEKHSLATNFLEELDTMVTGGQLAALSESTGGVKIVWSKTLNSTAGRAKWQREAIRTTETTSKTASTITTYKHNASIELAEKVIDDEDRLLNVLAHEFCHLANFMVSNVKDQPHGRSFKEWAAKVMAKFPHKNINVTTKHSYDIDYKYVWGCIECGIEYKRHSKSIDPGRHTCGACKGKLVQIKPVQRGANRSGTDKNDNHSGNPYQAFVKKWYASVKQEHPDWKMGEIMSEIAKRYKLEKETTSTQESHKKDIGVLVLDEVDSIIMISDDDVASDDQPMQKLKEQLTDLALIEN